MTGSTYYAIGTVIHTAVIHAGMTTAGSTITVYTYEIGPRNIFYQSTAFGITSSYSTNQYGIILTTSSTQPTYSLTATPITVYLPATMPGGIVYGAGIYPYSQPVEKVVLHTGLGWLGQTVSLWFHYLRDDNVFYPATQFTIGSWSYSTLAAGFAVAQSLVFDYPASTVTPITLSYEPSATGCTGFGGRYSFTSDLAALAILEDLIKEGERKTINVHNIATQTVFYGGAKYWFSCGYSLTSNMMIMLTATSKRSTPTQQQQVKLRFSSMSSGWTGNIYGTRVYTYTSDLEKVAYHMGLLNVNEEKSFYLYPVTGWDIFYASTRRGVTSGYSATAQAAFTLSTSAIAPTDLTTPNSFQVDLDGFSRTGWYLYGCGYYLWYSDLALAGMQMGLVGFEQTVRLWVHRIPGNNPNPWYYCNSYGIASSYSTTAAVGFILSTNPTNPGTVNANPFSVTIGAYYYPTGSDAIGTTVYRSNSDITAAAFHMNLMTYGQTKTLYLWQIGTSPYYYGSCNRGFCSSPSATSLLSWTLSTTATAPPQVALGGSIHQVTLNMSPGLIPGSQYGYQPFRSSSCVLDAAAFMTDLAKPGQSVTLFIHNLGTVNFFTSAVVHGYQTYTYAGADTGYLILNSAHLR